MLFRLEIQIAKSPRAFLGFQLIAFERCHHAMRAGELRHDETASALIADQPAKNRIGDTGHRRQHCGGRNAVGSNLEFGWKNGHPKLF